MHAPAAPFSEPSPRTAADHAGKGRQTRHAILDRALQMAGRIGLEGLSIGPLAEAMGMSKSGVFAHFGSRDELQIAVIRHYHQRFDAAVFQPAMLQPRGLPRLQLLFARWVDEVGRELESGCIYISGAVEFDDRPGPVRDALVEMVRTWHNTLRRACAQAIEVGHLRADTDPAQLVFEMQSLVLGLHHDARFLHVPGCLDMVGRAWQRLLDGCLSVDGRAVLQRLQSLRGQS